MQEHVCVGGWRGGVAVGSRSDLRRSAAHAHLVEPGVLRQQVLVVGGLSHLAAHDWGHAGGQGWSVSTDASCCWRGAADRVLWSLDRAAPCMPELHAADIALLGSMRPPRNGSAWRLSKRCMEPMHGVTHAHPNHWRRRTPGRRGSAARSPRSASLHPSAAACRCTRGPG